MLAAFILAGCTSTETSNSDAKYTLHPLEWQVENDLSKCIEKTKVIKLETTSESLITNAVKVLLHDNGNIIIQDMKSVLCFDNNGKFLHTIGARGRANSEYQSLRDICIAQNGDITILDGMNKVIFYDGETGKFIKSVEPTWTANRESADAIIPCSDGGFYLVTSNPGEVANFDTPFYNLNKFDKEGKLTEQTLPRKDFVFTMALVTQNPDNKYLVRPQEGDNVCYEIDSKDQLIAKYKIDFGDKAVPERYIFDDKGNVDFGKYMGSNFYKLPMNLFETDDYLTFIASAPQASSHNFVYSKDDNKGIQFYAPGIDRDMPQFLAADEDFVYCMVQSLPDDTSNSNPLVKHLKNDKDIVLNDAENPILVGVKFKL